MLRNYVICNVCGIDSIKNPRLGFVGVVKTPTKKVVIVNAEETPKFHLCDNCYDGIKKS